MSEANIKDAVKEKYGEAALRATTGGSSCCGATAASASCGCDPITSNLYDAAQAYFTVSAAGLLAAALPAGFGAGLAALFFNAIRAAAGGAALARSDTDDFDFAAIFLRLATALAMTADIREEEKMRAIHHVWAVPRKARSALQRYR